VHATPASVLADLEEPGERIKSRIITPRRRKLRKLKKPKRPKTAYNFFQLDEKEHAQGCLVHNEKYARNIGQLWKHLTPERRAYYQRLSVIDRYRYESENKEYLRALAGKMKKKMPKKLVKRESLPSVMSEPISSEPLVLSGSEPSVSFLSFASEPPATLSAKANSPPFKELEPLSFMTSEHSYLTSDSEPLALFPSNANPSLHLKSIPTPSVIEPEKEEIKSLNQPSKVANSGSAGTKRKNALDEPLAKRCRYSGLPDLMEDPFDVSLFQVPTILPDEDDMQLKESEIDTFESLDLDLAFDTQSPSIFNDQDHAFVDNALVGF